MRGCLLVTNLALVISCLGCPTDSQNDAPGKAELDKTGAKQGPKPEPQEKAEPAPTKPPLKLGKIIDGGLLPLNEMMAKDPPTVQSFLGEHIEKGGTRDSCTRVVPVEKGGKTVRIWYQCAHAWQRYVDKNGKLSAVYVEYENGKSSLISLEGFPGEGEFKPELALKMAGLDLPGEPRIEEPAEGVTVWSYWNSAARLKIEGREYRVEVSVVKGEWHSAKVTLMLNDHLTDSERKGLMQVDGQKVAPGPG